MKQVKVLLAIAALSFGTLSITSCGSDAEVCPVGYEGKDCKVLSRDKFIGSWNGSEECTVGNDNYVVKVSASTTSDIKIVIDNVYNEAFVATGTMSSTDQFDFSGSYTGAGTATYTGTGTMMADGKLQLKYTISGATSNSCTFTGSKL